MIIPEMTDEQLEAVTTRHPLCYVKAGPGSGKTFLASEALGYLRYYRHKNQPKGIVGVTFARSAVTELKRRTSRRWGQRTVDWPNKVCTFDELHRQLTRRLTEENLIHWPSTDGQLPDKIYDSWHCHEDATSQPGKKQKYILGVDDYGRISIDQTKSKLVAPNPCFTNKKKYEAALSEGFCTHAETRRVLLTALDEKQHPKYVDVIRDYLNQTIAHLIVDEAFDMNPLDIAIVENAIKSGVPVTLIGDPWQSLYEFRGSTPKGVQDLIDRYPFKKIDMPGKHRYQTKEMLDLSLKLFNDKPFKVKRASKADDFQVVLAHDWNTLWDETRIAVLPAGRPSKIGKNPINATFILLLNRLAKERLGYEATGIGEARRVIGSEEELDTLDQPLRVLQDPERSAEQVWDTLRTAFCLPADTEPTKTAKKRMNRLVKLARTEDVWLGLTIHQAKGLEWNNVLLLDNELSTDTKTANKLEQKHQSHRRIYVGLTRARQMVRVVDATRKNYDTEEPPVEKVPI